MGDHGQVISFLTALSGKGRRPAPGFLPSAIRMHPVRHFLTVEHVVRIAFVGIRKDPLHVGERLQSVVPCVLYHRHGDGGAVSSVASPDEEEVPPCQGIGLDGPFCPLSSIRHERRYPQLFIIPNICIRTPFLHENLGIIFSGLLMLPFCRRCISNGCNYSLNTSPTISTSTA